MWQCIDKRDEAARQLFRSQVACVLMRMAVTEKHHVKYWFMNWKKQMLNHVRDMCSRVVHF